MTDSRAETFGGPLMCDIQGTRLSDRESAWLSHPCVGGIILFARNVESPEQMRKLCDDIRQCRPNIVIGIDQEGGRVQRLRNGVTNLPPMARLGHYYRQSPDEALTLARDTGWLLAMEMAACGADFSFAPVLDLDDSRCPAIGNRAFSDDPQHVSALGGAFIEGFREAGMASIGKHFPGHGGVTLDSHLVMPEDTRTLETLESHDLIPFRALSDELTGVMPAHVRFTQIDDRPAGFSRRWLEYLRHDIGFEGVIVSDDLSMEGAAMAGGPGERVLAALDAGCDLTLLCNDPDTAAQARDTLTSHDMAPASRQRLSRLYFSGERLTLETLMALPRWQRTRDQLQQID
ncbi:beta-N-acetylhexosaminidase [Kushneria indalinina]|uniref:Beta-hexosaminidase n=1 Tax=Kushneria indalinina DSM 14324 TaxID=1122140 RepID=A0A3D9DZB1_9GAMM|nr:beta-N-acetylhexosaminidase [Kushneria indalinina]REC96041.1 beta-N-acetylhexosaminidase [Kushneria indalinina DSM 14324]